MISVPPLSGFSSGRSYLCPSLTAGKIPATPEGFPSNKNFLFTPPGTLVQILTPTGGFPTGGSCPYPFWPVGSGPGLCPQFWKKQPVPISEAQNTPTPGAPVGSVLLSGSAQGKKTLWWSLPTLCLPPNNGALPVWQAQVSLPSTPSVATV